MYRLLIGWCLSIIFGHIAGKPSLVFDCVFSSKIKSKTTKDKEFKTYIVRE